MAEHVIFFAFLSLSALLFALLEIQIEGRHGWAESLPTWRVENRWTRLIYRKPVTGYHVYAQAFVLVLSHAPFGLGFAGWGMRPELRVLSFVVLFWLLEDFLWFACNPAYGVRRFDPESIAWHRDAWWWIAPRDYWIGVPVGLVLYYLA
ncbi:MAG TPA: hypothetical protein VMD08_13250 [Candidatus Baltobacteraceae bacterium]|nr:hypothetical protein [Candidatus Baltobacteraceae bacterium]